MILSSGAMENWGLITYRESCLLLDPENTSTMRKQFIALIVGHEVAHQWFGNLVTMVSCGCSKFDSIDQTKKFSSYFSIS